MLAAMPEPDDKDRDDTPALAARRRRDAGFPSAEVGRLRAAVGVVSGAGQSQGLGFGWAAAAKGLLGVLENSGWSLPAAVIARGWRALATCPPPSASGSVRLFPDPAEAWPWSRVEDFACALAILALLPAIAAVILVGSAQANRDHLGIAYGTPRRATVTRPWSRGGWRGPAAGPPGLATAACCGQRSVRPG